jgi:hypothetical protein
MPEVGAYTFSYKEVVEALIKFQDLHEGHWQLNPGVKMSASNLGQTMNHLKPTIVISIDNFGLLKVEQETNMTVNAAKVNPVKTE